MSFIEMNLGSDVKEKENAPEGRYDLVVTGIKLKEYDAKNEDETETGEGHYLQVIHEIESAEGSYQLVYHNLWLPNALDSKEKVYNKQVSIKRYLSAAGVPYEGDGFNPDDIAGARFSCDLGVEIDESGKYDPKNFLKLPKFKG